MKVFCISLIILGLFCINVKCSCESAQHSQIWKLKNNLLCDYDKDEGPLINKEHIVAVTVMVVFKHIKFTDAKRHFMDINTSVGVLWSDINLKWDPKKWYNIDEIHLNTNDIWSPQLDVAHMGQHTKLLDSASCIVRWNGKVACSSGVSSLARCDMISIRYWPLDTITCVTGFNSGIKNTSMKLSMHANPVFLYKNMKHPEWKLLHVSPHKQINTVKKDAYESLYYSYSFSRKAAGAIATNLMPLLGLSIITLATPGLPAIEKERLSIAFINIISHVFYMHNLYWVLPYTHTIPLIYIYSTTSFILAVTIMFISLMVRSMLTKEKAMPPMWLIGISRLIVSKLGEYLRLSRELDLNGYTELQKVTKDERADRLLIYQVVDKAFFIISFVIYVTMIIVFVSMYACS